LFLLFCCALQAALRLVLAARAGRGGIAAGAALALAQGGMLWLHHTAAIANLALNLFVLVALVLGGAGLARGLARLAAADALALALSSAPILWAIGHAGEGAFVTRWIAPPGLGDAALLYARELVAPFQSPLSALTLALSAGSLVLALLARGAGRAERVALVALLVGAGLLFPLLSQRWPVMIDRTVLFLLAPLAAAIAAGMARLPRRAFAVAAALLLALHAFGALRFHLLPQTREDWNGAAALLAERRAPGEALLVTDSVFAWLSLRAAFAMRGEPPPPMLLLPATSPLEARSAELLAPGAVVTASDLCARLAGASGAWLVTRPVPPVVADDPAFSTLHLARGALAAAGGAPADHQAPVGLVLERWRLPATC
ncbi:hypothetical protein, partial [Neoroseomonas rubea]|uniref:hypothetical protein n=1 Tax=Neoroseomonas rubea TaxID=2748666 RepID=UPI0018DF41B4